LLAAEVARQGGAGLIRQCEVCRWTLLRFAPAPRRRTRSLPPWRRRYRRVRPWWPGVAASLRSTQGIAGPRGGWCYAKAFDRSWARCCRWLEISVMGGRMSTNSGSPCSRDG